MTDYYVYAGDGAGYVYKYKKSDLSFVTNTTDTDGLVRGLVIDDTYVFTGTWGKHVRKFYKSDLSYITEAYIEVYATGLDIDENYVYVLRDGTDSASIRKYDKNLVLLNTQGFNAVPLRAANDDNYLYVCGSSQYVKKYNKSDLTLVATSPALGGYVYDVEVDENYVYASVRTLNKIKKLNKNDLTVVSESPTISDNLARLCSDNLYIYVAPTVSPYNIKKYRKSDLTLVTTSPYDLGASGYDIECDNWYIYVVCGAYIKKFNKNDLSYVETTEYYDSTRYEVEVDIEPVTEQLLSDTISSSDDINVDIVIIPHALDLNETFGIQYYIPNSGNDYEKINDPNPRVPDNNTFINTNRNELQRFFGLPIYNIDLDEIEKIEVHTIARVEENYDNVFTIAIKKSDNIYYGNNIKLNSYWKDYSYSWEKNPATNLPWTLNDINDLQIGFKALESDVDVLISAVYMVLHYRCYSNPHLSINDFISGMKMFGEDLILTSDENIVVFLHKPYLGDGLTGDAAFDYTNLQFKDISHYESYVNSLNRDSITITGFEYDNAFYKLRLLSSIADKGSRVTITRLGKTWDNTYIISDISYKIIGKYCGEDVWEYNIKLLKAEDEIYEP